MKYARWISYAPDEMVEADRRAYEMADPPRRLGVVVEVFTEEPPAIFTEDDLGDLWVTAVHEDNLDDAIAELTDELNATYVQVIEQHG